MKRTLSVDRPRRPTAMVGLLVVALLALTSLACSVGSVFQGGQAGNATPTKTPRPTFTPLPGALTSQSVAGASVGTGTPGATTSGSTSLTLFATDTPEPSPTPTFGAATATPPNEEETNQPSPQPTAYVVVKPDSLRGRRGPGPSYEQIGQAEQGQELFVLGRTVDDAWLQVCCLANQPVWVASDQVDVKGEVAVAAVLTPPPTPLPATPTRPPLPASTRIGQSPVATPRPVGTPLPPFDVARGPEFPIRRDNGLLTIWVKVYEGPLDNQRPLGGYILKVLRDGVDISDNLESFGDRPFDRTPPTQGAYLYNLKFERYEAGEANWEIYLARPGGFRMSPITKFTTLGDSYRNLVVYIAYLLAR